MEGRDRSIAARLTACPSGRVHGESRGDAHAVKRNDNLHGESGMQEELKKMLSAKPFVPFTIVMSDGTHITVKHPENAWLMKHWIYVTTDGGETAEQLYLLHVTRIQRQQKDAA